MYKETLVLLLLLDFQGLRKNRVEFTTGLTSTNVKHGSWLAVPLLFPKFGFTRPCVLVVMTVKTSSFTRPCVLVVMTVETSSFTHTAFMHPCALVATSDRISSSAHTHTQQLCMHGFASNQVAYTIYVRTAFVQQAPTPADVKSTLHVLTPVPRHALLFTRG